MVNSIPMLERTCLKFEFSHQLKKEALKFVMSHLFSALVFLALFFVPLLYGIREHCGGGFGRSQAS